MPVVMVQVAGAINHRFVFERIEEYLGEQFFAVQFVAGQAATLVAVQVDHLQPGAANGVGQVARVFRQKADVGEIHLVPM